MKFVAPFSLGGGKADATEALRPCSRNINSDVGAKLT